MYNIIGKMVNFRLALTFGFEVNKICESTRSSLRAVIERLQYL